MMVATAALLRWGAQLADGHSPLPPLPPAAATLMNKGLEVIEAHYLFGADYDNIEIGACMLGVEWTRCGSWAAPWPPVMASECTGAAAHPSPPHLFKPTRPTHPALTLTTPPPPTNPPGAVIHPQSIIHSMVETADSSVLAQLGWPDMRLPILYTMSWPARVQCSEQTWPRLDFVKMGDLTFRRGTRRAAGGVLGGTGRPRVCHYTGRAIVWQLGPSLCLCIFPCNSAPAGSPTMPSTRP